MEKINKYLQLIDELNEEAKKAAAEEAAANAEIMELYEGSRLQYKRTHTPEEVEKIKKAETAAAEKINAANDNKKLAELAIRIAMEQLNYYGLNLIIERIKNDPPKGIDKPFHYKAFKKALEGITPEGFSAYAGTSDNTLTVKHTRTGYNSKAEKYYGYKTETFSAEVTKDWTTFNVIEPENIKAAAADVIRTRKEIERLYEETKAKIDGLRASVNKFAGRTIHEYLPYAPVSMNNCNYN